MYAGKWRGLVLDMVRARGAAVAFGLMDCIVGRQ